MFIRTIRPSNKLNFINLRPFKILKILRPITYKLNLLAHIKITQVQHISVLKLTYPDTPLEEYTPGINLNSQEKD